MNDISENYPPYNIESNGKDSYTIEIAVAGFDENNLTISLENGQLTVIGNREDDNSQYMHRGIANRSFKRTFKLAEYVEVIGAGIKNGILEIKIFIDKQVLTREKIFIGAGNRVSKFFLKPESLVELTQGRIEDLT